MDDIVKYLNEDELKIFKKNLPSPDLFNKFFRKINIVFRLKDKDNIYLGEYFIEFINCTIPGSDAYVLTKNLFSADKIPDGMFINMLLFMINCLNWVGLTLCDVKKLMSITNKVISNDELIAFAIESTYDGYKTIVISDTKVYKTNVRLVDIKYDKTKLCGIFTFQDKIALIMVLNNKFILK